MKKDFPEALIIIVIGLALIFFEAIVKFLGLVIVIYGIVELIRERKEKKAASAKKPEETKSEPPAENK